MTPELTLTMADGRRLCEGMGWYDDSGTVYCVQPDGSLGVSGRRAALVPAGTFAEGAVQHVSRGSAVVTQAGTVVISDLRRRRTGPLSLAAEVVGAPGIGRDCVAWLEPMGPGLHELHVWRAGGGVRSWGQVPWTSIEDVADCDALVIGRDATTLYRSTPDSTAPMTAVRGEPIADPWQWRFDGTCDARLQFEAQSIELVCDSGRARVPLPSSWVDDGYVVLEQLHHAKRTVGILVHGAPGLMFAAVVHPGRAAPPLAALVRYAPGLAVPSRAVEQGGELCVVWHANDGERVEGTWLSCVDGRSGAPPAVQVTP